MIFLLFNNKIFYIILLLNDKKVGDGTTSVTLIAGELLKESK